MSRRTGRPRDPTGDGATSTEAVERLNDLLGVLTERERQAVLLSFGINHARRRMTYAEVGQELGISHKEVHRIIDLALKKLRHPPRSKGLVGILDGETSLRTIPDALREQILGAKVLAPPPVYCERHGWSAPATTTITPCAHCPCPIRVARYGGRPAKFCSNECRQAAYRKRKRGEPHDL